MSLLGLKDALDGLARASGVRWYGHVLRRDMMSDEVVRALYFEVVLERPNMPWKRQVEIGLKKEDATDRTKWCNGVYELETLGESGYLR